MFGEDKPPDPSGGSSVKQAAGLVEVVQAAQSQLSTNSAMLETVRAAQRLGDSAKLQTAANVAKVGNFEVVGRLVEAYRTPAILKLIDGINPMLTRAGVMQASGIASQLESVVAMFAPQRAALDAIAATQLAHYKPFREQMLQVVSAQESVSRVFAGTNYSTMLTALFETVARYGQVQAHLASATIRPEVAQLLRGHTTRSSLYYDSYLDGLPARPIARRATVARQAGDTQTGLLIAESLTAPDLDADDREELAEHLTITVLEPWQSGPADARTHLFDVLATMDPGLPDWLKAAWDDVVRDGPKAASKIANCTVECIDRALRFAAPSVDVALWLNTVPPKPGYLHEGRPTRRARIMFVMRDRADREGQLAVAQVEALVVLIQEVSNNLQSVKHGSAPSITTMRSWLLAAEGALSQLFLQA